jgi:sortase A
MLQPIKKTLFAVLCLTLCASCSAPVFAYDSTYATSYGFSSGPNSDSTFGNPSGYDEPARTDPLSTNQRRNKDAAFLPPAYGIFSGEIPTDPSSPYHDNTPVGGYTQLSGFAPVTSDSAGGEVYSTSVSSGYAVSTVAESGNYSGGGTSSLDTSYTNQTGLLQSTSVSAGYNTLPKYNDDGSMGKLYIERFDKTLKVYEGETLENMRKGLGHFESTSAWDGNVGFAGHNRGASAYFSFVKDIKPGDKITYTTPYGSRTYEVYRKEKIDEYDYSGLGWTTDNVLTLITCVENQSELRWIVQAAEVR